MRAASVRGAARERGREVGSLAELNANANYNEGEGNALLGA